MMNYMQLNKGGTALNTPFAGFYFSAEGFLSLHEPLERGDCAIAIFFIERKE